jgi:site-specific recombinase XerD
MVSLDKHKGRYRARFYDKRRDPKRKEVALGTSLKSSAKLKMRKMEKAYARGEYDPWKDEWTGENTTLPDAAEQYLEKKGREVRETTLSDYEGYLDRFVEHAPSGATMRDVRPEHVRSFIHARANVGQSTEGPPANSTIRTRHQSLHTFFSWAEENGLVGENPVDEVHKPKKQKGRNAFLKPEHVKKILCAIDAHREERKGKRGPTPESQWLKQMIRVAVSTGLRRGELFNLRWKDIDFESGRLMVRNRADFTTKSGEERMIPLRGKALRTLQETHEKRTLAPEDPVFVQKNGDPPSPSTATGRFKSYVRELGLPDAEDLCLHSTRHTTGSWLSMQGVAMRIIQEILGHSNTSTTQKYSHLNSTAMDEAMEKTFGDG